MSRKVLAALFLGLMMLLGGCIVHHRGPPPPRHRHVKPRRHRACPPGHYWDGRHCRNRGRARGHRY
jgi:hypothetical protein